MNDAFNDALDEQQSERRPGLLVVDDDEMVRRNVKEDLEGEGFAVWAAKDDASAVDVYWQHRGEIDVVLLEVFLAGGDGRETLVDLQRIYPAVRCCFMKGRADGPEEEELLELGAVGLLHKPFDPRAMARVFRGPLNRRYRQAAQVKDRVAAGSG
jgi:DNA-binding response OmpR family regulator